LRQEDLQVDDCHSISGEHDMMPRTRVGEIVIPTKVSFLRIDQALLHIYQHLHCSDLKHTIENPFISSGNLFPKIMQKDPTLRLGYLSESNFQKNSRVTKVIKC